MKTDKREYSPPKKSTLAYAATWRRRDLTPNDKAVFQLLKLYAVNKTQGDKKVLIADMPLQALMDALNLSRKTVIDSVKNLERVGLVRKTRRGHMLTNVYELHEFDDTKEGTKKSE